MMNQTVVIPKGLSQAGKDYLKNHGLATIELADLREENILAQAPAAAGIVLMMDPFSAATAKKMPNLKVVARHGVGYDNVDPATMAQAGVWVTITPNANASTVAETTLAEILDLSKNLTAISTHMRQGDFDYKGQHMGFDLSGKKLGIMGFGRIGRMVAQKVSGLGMDILIYDPFVKQTDIGRLVDRETLFKAADVITLHMAVTPENTNGIGQKEFAAMKKQAVLINLGRGALVDQPALLTALKTGEIGGAALDVFDEEPLPLSSEFYTLNNVLLTPHIASNTQECMSRMAVDAASEVVRVLNGDQPQWPVNHPAKD
ncbi:phosphoglycerate dehydrogenase [Levilactobacillus enshiensis]|uniref:phosphoglycerate dehydrogenase n=1 Tax=Levilactobacillus enshiensis TaxID=2590213 RepID=UPI001179EFFD|nr:phosphoglycerate dehydrogenase [Levilactobacillus enshiensis]